MAIKYLLNTPNSNNTLPGSQIQSGTITSTQVDGTIALQSALDAAIKGMAPKGSVRTILELPQLTNSGETPSFTWSGGGQTITSTTNFTLVGMDIGGVSDLANGDKVLVSFSSADKQYAGIYDITSVGVASVSPVILTRASNFNETAEVALNSYVVVLAGDYADEIWYLTNTETVTINTTPLTFALWGGTGSTYTAGNGIDLTGAILSANLLTAGGLGFGTGGDTNKLIVKVAASNALLKDGSTGELSVRTASASVSGVITSTQFKDLTRTVAASEQSASAFTTENTQTTDFPIPVTPESTVAYVHALVRSKDNASEKWCITEVRFALRRVSGNSTLINDSTVTVFKEGDTSGITGLTVTAVPGVAGADVIRVAGVNTFTISHYAVATVQHLPG